MQNKHTILFTVKLDGLSKEHLVCGNVDFPVYSRGLTNKLICSTSIVMACAVLHNLSLYYDNILPEDRELYEEIKEVPVEPFPQQPGEGFAVRAALINRLFT